MMGAAKTWMVLSFLLTSAAVAQDDPAAIEARAVDALEEN